MSYACLQSGLILYTILLVGTAILSHFAMTLLFRTVELLNFDEGTEVQYPLLGKVLYGRKGELVASWSVTLQQFGACIAYVVIIGDVLKPVLGLLGWEVLCHRYFIQLIVMSCIVFPLCLLRNMDSLKYTSFLALFFIGAFVLAVVGNGMYTLSDPHMRHEAPDSHFVCGTDVAADFEDPSGTEKWGPNGSNFLKAVPIVCFAFLCHQNAFPIYDELPNANLQKMSYISRWSMVLCGSIYYLAGLFGYLTFLDATDADLLKNFYVLGTDVSILMDVVRVGFGIALIFSYPVVVWEARRNLTTLIFGDMPYSFTRNFIMNLGIVAITTTVGVVAPGVESVLGVVGSTCSPMMMFVCPAAFYLRAEDGAWTAPHKLPALGLLIYGCVLIPVCTTVWAINL